jgi:hypothetical protein
MTMPLRSDPITEPSTLLRAPPPLCPASVLRPLRRLAAWVSPFASGRQIPAFLTEACLEVTPPSCRTPVGPSAGIAQPLLAGQRSRSRFRRRFSTLRHVITRVRLLKTHLTEYLPPFPTTLTTRALYPRSLWRFEACPCRPAPGGRPPSPVQLRFVSSRDEAFTAHDLFVFDRTPEPLDEDVVPPRSLAVHAERDALVAQQAGEADAGELRSLDALLNVKLLLGSDSPRLIVA